MAVLTCQQHDLLSNIPLNLTSDVQKLSIFNALSNSPCTKSCWTVAVWCRLGGVQHWGLVHRDPQGEGQELAEGWSLRLEGSAGPRSGQSRHCESGCRSVTLLDNKRSNTVFAVSTCVSRILSSFAWRVEIFHPMFSADSSIEASLIVSLHPTELRSLKSKLFLFQGKQGWRWYVKLEVHVLSICCVVYDAPFPLMIRSSHWTISRSSWWMAFWSARKARKVMPS